MYQTPIFEKTQKKSLKNKQIINDLQKLILKLYKILFFKYYIKWQFVSNIGSFISLMFFCDTKEIFLMIFGVIL